MQKNAKTEREPIEGPPPPLCLRGMAPMSAMMKALGGKRPLLTASPEPSLHATMQEATSLVINLLCHIIDWLLRSVGRLYGHGPFCFGPAPTT